MPYNILFISDAAQDPLGRPFVFKGINLDRHFNIRLPLGLFQELARQAAERGLPVGAFIRSQLAANITNPTNIYKIDRNT